MSRAERNFTPLSEINNQGAIEVPIWQRGSRYSTEISINLPLQDYVPQNKVGVNLPALSRRARMGGIKKVDIVGDAGEVSNYTPGVVGHNKDGAAMAGAKGTAKDVKTSSSESNISPVRNPAISWADIKVNVNTSEILDRIKKDVRSPDALSREINTAFQRDIAFQGNVHLLGGIVGVTAQLGVVDLEILPMAVQYAQSEADLMIPTFLAANLVGNVLLLGTGLYRRQRGSYHVSLFAGTQLDRMAILTTMAKKDEVFGTQSLVRPLPSKKS